MTSPVTSGSAFHQAQATSAPVEDVQQVQDSLEVDNKEAAKPSLQDQFDNLMSRYYTTLRVTAGCGDRAQGYIDAEYAQLSKFATEHPEFKAQLPKKQISRDDGTGGFATGMATFGADARRNGDDCSIQ